METATIRNTGTAQPMSEMSRHDYDAAQPASAHNAPGMTNSASAADIDSARDPIGIVLEIAGSGSQTSTTAYLDKPRVGAANATGTLE